MPAADNIPLRNLLGLSALSLATPPVNPHANALAQYFSGNPFTISGRWYQKKHIQLDGYKFIRCRFDDCEVITVKGTFDIDHCYFSNCIFQYGDNAQKVLKLYNLIAREARDKWPDLIPTYHAEDGTFSITVKTK